MIGNKLEQDIIGVFQYNLCSTFSINEVSKKLHKAYPYINKKTNFFFDENILKKIPIGKSYQCFLNLSDEKTRIFMAMNEINRKQALLTGNGEYASLDQEIAQLTKKFSIESILLYKRSIIFILPDLGKKDKIMEYTVLTKNYTILFFTKSSFQEYFIDNNDIQKYHTVLSGTDWFIRMIAELEEKLLMKALVGDKTITKESSKGK